MYPRILARKRLLVIELAVLCIGQRCAADSVWTDGTGSWFTAANWSGGVPFFANADIDNGGTAQITANTHGSATAANVNLGQMVTDNGALTLSVAAACASGA